MGIKCFWLEPTDRQRLYLRRYQGNLVCPVNSYHDAMVDIGESKEWMDTINGHWCDDGRTAKDFLGDPRWPVACACGYVFQAADEQQLFSSHIYRRADTGEEMTLRDAPDGAMWDADWFHGIPEWCGDDGRSIICRVPNKHDWQIDGACSNCTRPGEKHKCWIRHGEPPLLTVDKNGNTCSAGGGSILTPAWHGFLRNGELV